MTDKDKILMYEISNTFIQRYCPFLMPKWLLELQGKIVARKFNKKWANYQKALALDEFMRWLWYEWYEKQLQKARDNRPQ